MKPTDELYKSLQSAYAHFNSVLFENKLPNVIFTVQRQKGILGYFAPERWSSLSGKHCHEIAINPSHMGESRLIEVLQTLVHEMVHCWQFCFGNASRPGYHNKEWAYKMKEIGLQPTSTGLPGGDIVGQQMSDYPIKDGAFLKACHSLVVGQSYEIPWIDRRNTPKSEIHTNATTQFVDGLLDVVIPEHSGSNHFSEIMTSTFSEILPKDTFFHEPQVDRKKNTYQCPVCLTKVWGKPGLNLICGDCDEEFDLI